MNLSMHNFGNGVLPKRGYDSDVGADLITPVAFSIQPGAVYCLDLEIGVSLPEGMAGFVWPKSSGAKRGIVPLSPPVDPGYEGPIHAMILNTSSEVISFEAGDKVAQFLVMPYVSPNFVWDTDVENNKKRGAGWNGSSGK